MSETEQKPIVTFPLESPISFFVLSQKLLRLITALIQAFDDGVKEVEIKLAPSNRIRVTAVPDGEKELQIFAHKPSDITVTAVPTEEDDSNDEPVLDDQTLNEEHDPERTIVDDPDPTFDEPPEETKTDNEPVPDDQNEAEDEGSKDA